MVATPAAIERVAVTYREAARRNRETPGRRGNIVVLDESLAGDVMVTADLHGHRLNFAKLLKTAGLDQHPRRHLVMQEVCHGGPTYPSGGCMSHLMLEDVARVKTQYPERFHFLMSNHELAELTDFPITKNRKVLNLAFRCGMSEMYGEAADDVRAACLEFLASLPLAIRCGGAFICHSLPEGVDQHGFDASVFERPLTAEDLACGGAAFKLVWGRDFRPANADAFARLVGADVLIHGHVPCSAGFALPNERQVILDCCGEHACYLLLSPAGAARQTELAQRIERLE